MVFRIIFTKEGSYCDYLISQCSDWKTWPIGTPSKSILKLVPASRIFTTSYDISRPTDAGCLLLKCNKITVHHPFRHEDIGKFLCIRVSGGSNIQQATEDHIKSRIQPMGIDLLGFIKSEKEVDVIWKNIQLTECYSYSMSGVECWLMTDVKSLNRHIIDNDVILGIDFNIYPVEKKIFNVCFNGPENGHPIFHIKYKLPHNDEIISISYNIRAPLRTTNRKGSCLLM